jgi:hypothetical protein
MSFQCADHDILRAKVYRLRAGWYPGGLFLILNSQAESVLLDRLEVGATRDDTDVMAGERKLDREVTTDSSGTVDTHFHVIFISSSTRQRPRRMYAKRKIRHPQIGEIRGRGPLQKMELLGPARPTASA